MTDTPISNASTLWLECGPQDHVVVAQAGIGLGQLQQSLNRSKVVDKVIPKDSASIDLEKIAMGTTRKRSTFENT